MQKKNEETFESTSRNIDRLINEMGQKEKEKPKYTLSDRIRFAHDIKQNPPKPGFMKTVLEPGIYSIDLNTDANWWFNHQCTVFPLLLTQAKRTYFDLQESFKKEKWMPDFNIMWLMVIIIGICSMLLIAKFIFNIF
jgi:hypothetical protein